MNLVDSGGLVTETCTLKFVVYEAGSFSSPPIITPASEIVSQVTSYDFEIQPETPIQAGGFISIRYLSTTADLSTATLIPGTNIKPFAAVFVDVDQRLFVIVDAFEINFSGMTTFHFTLAGVKNPSSLKPESIEIKTLDAEYYIVDESSTTITMMTPGIHGTITITPETLENNQIGYYDIDLVTSEIQDPTDQINIIFPSTLQLIVTSVSLLGSASPELDSVSYSISGNDLYLTFTLNSPKLPAGSLISVRVASLQNLVNSSPIGSFTVSTITADGYIKQKTIINPGLTTTVCVACTPYRHES